VRSPIAPRAFSNRWSHFFETFGARVPSAHNSAIPAGHDIFSRLNGSSKPFPPDKVQALYGGRSIYLARFEEAARSAEKAGVLLVRDVDGLLAEAATSWPLTDEPREAVKDSGVRPTSAASGPEGQTAQAGGLGLAGDEVGVLQRLGGGALAEVVHGAQRDREPRARIHRVREVAEV
jgi:hypothetical protein